MNTSGDELQFVAFRVGPQEFAVNIFQVERILRYERPASLPGTPDFLEGVVRYAGGVVPVVDLRKRLSVPSEVREEVRMMVLELETQRVAIVVDQVLEVLRIDAAVITAPPGQFFVETPSATVCRRSRARRALKSRHALWPIGSRLGAR